MFCLKKSLHRLNEIYERSLYLSIRKWIVLGQSKKYIKQKQQSISYSHENFPHFRVFLYFKDLSIT